MSVLKVVDETGTDPQLASMERRVLCSMNGTHSASLT